MVLETVDDARKLPNSTWFYFVSEPRTLCSFLNIRSRQYSLIPSLAPSQFPLVVSISQQIAFWKMIKTFMFMISYVSHASLKAQKANRRRIHPKRPQTKALISDFVLPKSFPTFPKLFESPCNVRLSVASAFCFSSD